MVLWLPRLTQPSLFIYSCGLTKLFILIYDDDIIIIGNSLACIMCVIHAYSSEFVLKNLGPLHFFHGIEVVPYRDDLFLSQQKYTVELLQQDGLLDVKSVSTLQSSSMTLSTSLFSDPTKYRQIVSALQYVTLTKLDLAFIVNKACQFMHQPTNAHQSAVKSILWYLRGTHATPMDSTSVVCLLSLP